MNNKPTDTPPTPPPPKTIVLRLPAWSWMGGGVVLFCSSIFVMGLGALLEAYGMQWARWARVLFAIPMLLAILSLLIGALYRLYFWSVGQHRTRPPRTGYSRVGGLLLLGGLLCVVLGDCHTKMQPGQPETVTRSPEPVRWKQQRLPGVPIAFQLPSDFQRTEQPQHDYLSFLQPSRRIRVVVQGLVRRDMAAESIEMAAKTTSQQWLAEVPESKFVSSEHVSTFNHPVFLQRFEVIDSGFVLQVVMEHHDFGSYWVELRKIAPPSQFVARQADLNRVSSSLRILGDRQESKHINQ